MGPRNKLGSPVPRRLKEAREAAGLSQAQLGILAGIDASVASSRVNHYEKNRHEPSFQIVHQLAQALKLPAAYFYADDDSLAAIIRAYAQGSSSVKKALTGLSEEA